MLRLLISSSKLPATQQQLTPFNCCQGLSAYPGLIVKDSYWRWPQRNLAGSTIDFFVQVLGLSFHQAMREITGAHD